MDLQPADLRALIQTEIDRALAQRGFHFDDDAHPGPWTHTDPSLVDMIGEPIAVYDATPPALELRGGALTDPGSASTPRSAGSDPSVRELGLFEPVPPRPGSLGDNGVNLPRTVAEVAASSFSTTSAAEALGVNSSRIRQRLGERSLYGFKHRGSWRLPRWQVDGGSAVPHLAAILHELDPDVSPVAVTRWFVTPGDDLIDEDRGVVLSPRQWLVEGRAPGPVAAQARLL